MTAKTFNKLAQKISNQPGALKTTWYDGHKFVAPNGAWYGWTGCGYYEYLFIDGVQYEKRTVHGNGSMTTEVRHVGNVEGATPVRVCDWMGCPEDCRTCPFGFLTGDSECPRYWTRAEAVEGLQEMIKQCQTVIDELEAE